MLFLWYNMNALRELTMLKIKIADLESNAKIVAETLIDGLTGENKTLPFLERVFKMLPELRSMISSEMDYLTIYGITKKVLEKRYASEYLLINKSVEEKNELVESLIAPAIKEMLKLFELPSISNIECELGFFNPFPRNVIDCSYATHYDIPNEVFIRVSLHEINHMILFKKWQELHGYALDTEPSYPDPLWFLEELSIEPTLNSPQIQRIAPYKHKAYASFYEITINGKCLPSIFNDIYKESNNIIDYLNQSFSFINENIQKIIDKK